MTDSASTLDDDIRLVLAYLAQLRNAQQGNKTAVDDVMAQLFDRLRANSK